MSKQHQPDRGIPQDETNNRKIDELIRARMNIFRLRVGRSRSDIVVNACGDS
jgi:hypothetical protein